VTPAHGGQNAEAVLWCVTLGAARSEEASTGKVSDFPACFEEHVLRRVHHSAAQRVEELVTRIHNHYKLNFVPGEECMAVGPSACPVPTRSPALWLHSTTLSSSVKPRSIS